MEIINLGSGKFKPLDLPTIPYFLLNLDTSYLTDLDGKDAECQHDIWRNSHSTKTIYCNEDVFEFMECTRLSFGRVCMYRFLEHIPFDKVAYFIYLVSTITKVGSYVDVIVPNYDLLAKMILNENSLFVYGGMFEAYNILVTTELLNEPGCPHASIWTPLRIKKFWELEERFKVLEIEEQFKFDGRDIYLRATMQRV